MRATLPAVGGADSPSVLCAWSAVLAGVGPSLEDVGLGAGPGTVAGHRPGTQAAQDGIGVRADVAVGPHVEREPHGLPILGPEHRLDVVFEADHLVGWRHLD